MRWDEELPPAIEVPRRQLMEWLIRSFQSLSTYTTSLIQEAPADGNVHVRENGAWVPLGEIPVFMETYTFAGTGTGLATGPGTFRADSATLASITAMRFNRFNSATIDMTTVFMRMHPQDRVLIQQTQDAAQAGVYKLTEDPVFDPGGDIILNNLEVGPAAGTAAGPMATWALYRS